ncbi:hypothetical protein A1A1_09886 [Planococcus antarcticus DSM 14505]|uniref:Holin n=1 Tax=Planococcus antarcticus DSM 14505 TaxID=1185653 RepID=A0A1C7DHK5_9BACL|nr:hypothetical protein [Planococcus antarcticus]ANU10751.1 hypothetical protein BBH88_10755 [Planococcus antarcticus DSM 14505]EIM06847.1 hypothetical protein A1A1_09886 [Planococcus antarcticus DSM 14505]
MKSVLFYFIPLLIFAVINNTIAVLSWPHYLVLLLAFLVFQLARLRYPKDGIPPIAKITQAAFYILTVATIFRDEFLSPLIINVLLGVTFGLVIAEIIQTKKKPA